MDNDIIAEQLAEEDGLVFEELSPEEQEYYRRGAEGSF